LKTIHAFTFKATTKPWAIESRN